MLIQHVKLDLLKCFLISAELIQEVPSHRIDVGSAGLLPTSGDAYAKCEEVFISNKALLLYDFT